MPRPRRRVRSRALCAAAALLGLFFTILAGVTVQSQPDIPFDRTGHVLFTQGSPDAATKVLTAGQLPNINILQESQ